MEAVATGFWAPSSTNIRKVLAATLSYVKQHKLQRSAAGRFGVSTKLLSKAIRLKADRKKLPGSIVKTVTEVFESVANPLPDKKMVSKKTGKPTSIMDRSLMAAYRHSRKPSRNANQRLKIPPAPTKACQDTETSQVPRLSLWILSKCGSQAESCQCQNMKPPRTNHSYQRMLQLAFKSEWKISETTTI